MKKFKIWSIPIAVSVAVSSASLFAQEEMQFPETKQAKEFSLPTPFTTYPGRSSNNEKFLAGILCSQKMFWRDDRLLFDTLGWNTVLADYLEKDTSGFLSPESSADLVLSEGKKLFRVKTPTAFSVAILRKLGYPLFVLTQWSGSVETGLDTRTTVQSETIISNFIWEEIDKAVLPHSFKKQGGIWVQFKECGSSLYEQKINMHLTRKQIAGTSGLGIIDKSRDVLAEDNMYRTLLEMVILVDKDKNQATISKEIESMMDSMGLDLTYTVPQFIELKK